MNNNTDGSKKLANHDHYLLIDEQDTLLTRHIKTKDSEELHSINYLQKIDSRNCFFCSGVQRLRVVIILPFLIILSINLFQFINDIYTDWKQCEEQLTSEISHYIKYTAENNLNLSNQERQSINERVSELRLFIGNDSSMDFNSYLYYRYDIYSYGSGYFWIDIIRIIYYIIFFTLYFYAFFLIKLKAPLILIRDRQLFMTWEKDKAYIARYSQVGVIENSSSVAIILYGLNNQKLLVKKKFLLHSSPLLILSTEKKQKDTLAFIAKYMVWGLSAVASTDYERNMPYYLRKDKKPADFEQQADQILAVLDKLESPRELNTLTDIKGN